MKDYRTHERLANRSIDRAQELACMVRDEGRDTVGAYLDRLDRQALYGLTVTLAAMVPVDQTADELLAWIEWDQTPVPIQQPKRKERTIPDVPEHIRKAHAAFQRAKHNGVEVPADIAEGERVYQALRYQARKRARQQGIAA